ncbi:MAG: hypothetical protein V4640_13660 [Verrucomicrobiota bacterium]
MMKTTLTAIAALVFLGASPNAEARSYRTTVFVSSYLPCGTPVYRERYCSGMDRWGNPVWLTRPCRNSYRPAYRPVVRPICRPARRPVYVAPCPPPRVRPGFGFQATWSH